MSSLVPVTNWNVLVAPSSTLEIVILPQPSRLLRSVDTHRPGRSSVS